MGIPSHGFRATLAEMAPHMRPGSPVISLTKGVERGTHLRMTEIVAEVLVGHGPDRIGVLTGPNLAREVAEGQPTASVVAVPDPAIAAMLQRLFDCCPLRLSIQERS